MELYDDIARSREIIKKKFNALRRGETEEIIKLEKHFKPGAEPLKAILKLKDEGGFLPIKKEEPQIKEEEPPAAAATTSADVFSKQEPEEQDDEPDDGTLSSYVTSRFGPLTGPYFYKMIKAGGKGPTEFDHLYGVRHGGGTVAEWMIGTKPVTFDKNDNLYVDGEAFTSLTPGLLELIFKRVPRDYTTSDLEDYKRLLQLTNAHRVSYDVNKPIRATRAQKYKDIIAKLFPPKSVITAPAQKKSATARATPKKKTPTKRSSGAGLFVPLESKRSYVYWDDPNELVKRLEVLVAEKAAGHTGHDREILSIEEELREAHIIL